MISKWTTKARGLKVDVASTAWNFMPAWKKDISFLVYELNPEFGMWYNSWVNGLTQPYNYKVPVIGVYNCSVNEYNKLIDFAYWDDLEGNVKPEHDPMWLHLESLLKSKWINALVINYVDFNEDGNPDKPIAPAHVQLIIRESMKRFKLRAPMVYPNRIKKVFIQIKESVITDNYPDLGGIMVEEDGCLTDLETLPKVVSIVDWKEFEGYLPPDKVTFPDGSLHDNPPISYTKKWYFWQFADFKNPQIRNGFLTADCLRPEGKAIMGGLIFNGDRNQLADFLGMDVPNFTDDAPTPPPVEPPPVDPDPDPEHGTDYVGMANQLDIIQSAVGKLKGLV